MSRLVAVDARLAEHSGIGVHLRNVLENLVVQRPDWRFRLLGPPEATAARFGAFENVTLEAARAKLYSLSEQAVIALKAGSDADILWSPHYNAALLAPTKLLVTVHDVNHLALPHLVKGVHRRLYARSMFEGLRRRADGLFFVSEFSRAEFQRLVGHPLSPTWITYNAVAPHWLTPSASPQGSPPRPYLVAVGNVKPHKNLAGLLEAFRRIQGRFDIDLILIGKREGFLHGQDLGAVLAEFGDRVRMAGEVTDADLKALVSGAAALVAPSIYEGFGIPPLEAMAVGCPTVVARSSALPEACGDASEYVDSADPVDIARGIAAVLSDESRAERLRAAGRQNIRRFSWANTAETVAGAIEALTERAGPSKTRASETRFPAGSGGEAAARAGAGGQIRVSG